MAAAVDVADGRSADGKPSKGSHIRCPRHGPSAGRVERERDLRTAAVGIVDGAGQRRSGTRAVLLDDERRRAVGIDDDVADQRHPLGREVDLAAVGAGRAPGAAVEGRGGEQRAVAVRAGRRVVGERYIGEGHVGGGIRHGKQRGRVVLSARG